MMAALALLFFFLWAFWATVFWLLRLPRVAGWLRLILQAENQKTENFVTCGIKVGKFCFSVVSLFMWVRRFTGRHKTATEGGCFLVLHCFSLPVAVWDERFSPHAIHGSMLKAPRCGCGGMQRPLKNSQENRFCREFLIGFRFKVQKSV
jgi:hypothetical protein